MAMEPKGIDALRARQEAGHSEAAVTAILEQHGGAFYGYIASIVGDESLAADAFQLFSLRLWQAFPEFRWESKLTTWAYAIARNAAYGALREPHRKRVVALGTAEELAIAARLTRTTTAMWERTEEKQRLWTQIEALPSEDRELLLLRVSSKLSWAEVVAVLTPETVEPTEVKRQAAVLRKRFERVKEQLKLALR